MLGSLRSSSRTGQPRLISIRTKWRPMNPLAPVTATSGAEACVVAKRGGWGGSESVIEWEA